MSRPVCRRDLSGSLVRWAALVLMAIVGATTAATPGLARSTGQGAAAPLTPLDASVRAFLGPFDPQVPAPEDALGFVPGENFRLADWPSILGYLRQLAEMSPRVTLEEIGTTSEGQPMVLASISAQENLEGLDRYREISTRLARADGVDEEEARSLAREGKTIVWIDSGLHATEVAPGQHTPELAYVLAAGESEEIRRMRQDTIVLLMPNMNPDGLNIVAEWYASHIGTSFETAPLPVLYHRYVGHDNNRDWYMTTQAETRAVSRVLYREWYPQIVYNHHQTAPFPARIFVPPFADPPNPNIHPLVVRGIARVGNAITSRLEQEGKSGAVSRMNFTAWWNGGMRTVPYFHNMVGVLTETALFRYATPNFYPPQSLPEEFRNGVSTREPTMDYPMPWQGGWWRLRDAVDYVLSASLGTIDVAARYREEWLLNSWRMGRDAIEDGRSGHPSGWIIPPDQHDPGAAAELVNVLLRGGLEVEIASEDFLADGLAYPTGSYIVPASQAFRGYAVDLLEPQTYPDRRLYPDGPPDPPYDVAGWTLPFQMGVDVDRIEAPYEAVTAPVTAPVSATGTVTGSGSTFLIDMRTNATSTAILRLVDAGDTVYWTGDGAGEGATATRPGTVVVPGGPGVARRVAALAEELGLQVEAVRRVPQGEGWQLRRPRVGLYEPWVASMDAGWTRWLLESYGIEYEVLRDAVVRKGGLGERFDAVVLPSTGAETLRDGWADGVMPDEYVGGLGQSGVAALREFVSQGGTLVCMDASCGFTIEELGLPVRDALEGLDREEFFCPGSLLGAEVDVAHPIAFGMPGEASVVFSGSRGFAIAGGFGDEASSEMPLAAGDEHGDVQVVMAYPEGQLLRSGWILGEEHLRGRGAVLEVMHGQGRVVLLGFRAQFRAQPHGTFKVLFNSLLLAAARPTPLP